MDEGVDQGAVPCVLQPHLQLDLAGRCLDDEAFALQQLCEVRRQVVPHVAATAVDELEAVAAEGGEEIPRDVALVGEDPALQAGGHGVQHGRGRRCCPG